jgi:hypothetical protein
MRTRLIAKLLALVGLYSLILAGIGMRFSGQTNSSTYRPGMLELAIVTVVFILIAAFMVTRRPREPLE